MDKVKIMIKRLKKELQINIEEKEGQLFLGDKNKDMRLVMLRPNEIMEFCDLDGHEGGLEVI